MRLPAPLLRRDRHAHKNAFGHILILAGSARMLGAAALSGLSAMRSGAGLVTLGIPEGLNAALQKKISPVLMTFPLKATPDQTIALRAFRQVRNALDAYDVVAIGPGLSRNDSTQRFILKVIQSVPKPMVIDADALNALSRDIATLQKSSVPKVLTPHPGEMARLTRLRKADIEKKRIEVALSFAKRHGCVLLLKGHHTVVASPEGKVYINRTGNPGMATAGSGDVLTGMIAAFLGQGLPGFEAAKFAADLHGRAGNAAAKDKTPTAMIATDIIDHIPQVLKSIR